MDSSYGVAVYDIERSQALTNEGFHPVSQSVSRGTDNRRIFFFHRNQRKAYCSNLRIGGLTPVPKDGLVERTFCFNSTDGVKDLEYHIHTRAQ